MEKIPVLLLVFCRKDNAIKMFESVRRYKPERLYIAADGPRKDKIDEDVMCSETRKYIMSAIDWPCEVKTLFRDKNLGCPKAVSEAISWFFEQEEVGIIVEDDIVLSQDFFKLCELLLPKYAKEDRIMQISARNTSFRTDINNTYVYSQCFHCWGWATWRRAWVKMDMNMKNKKLGYWYFIKRLGIVRGVMMKRSFNRNYRNPNNPTSWAVRWFFSILHYDGLVICPGVNLAINIGLDGGAHYDKDDSYRPGYNLKLNKIQWPLIYNDKIEIDRKQKIFDSLYFINNRFFGLKKKVKHLLNF